MTPDDPKPASDGVERRDTFDQAVRADLDRLQLEAVLARQDVSAELAREIQAAAPINLGDISDVVTRLGGAAVPSLGELEGLLSCPEAGVFQMDKGLLTNLLREGVEGQSVLKRGLTFIKHGKYSQAVEWWTLSRAGLNANTSKLHLLLLIMESLTHQWSGDAIRAEQTRQKVFTHPLFRSESTRRS